MDIGAIHGYIVGFGIIGLWAVLGLWSLVVWIATRVKGADVIETPWFWRAVSLAQIALVVQLLFGLALFAFGRRPGDQTLVGTLFHLSYGFLSPIVVLAVGHHFSRTGRINPHGAFALVGLVVFGLTFRAFQVAVFAA